MTASAKTPAASLAHLGPDRQDIAILTSQERIRLAREDAWIGYSAARSGLQRIEDLLDHPKSPRMPNILVVGDSGNGKTSLIGRFRELHPPTIKSNGRGEQPVVVMTMPAEPSEARFWSDLIAAMGVARNDSGSVQAKMSQAMLLLQSLHCRMLVIDEIHNVLNGNLPRQKQLLAMLKNLGSKLMIPIVVVGTEAAKRTLQTDPQLANRFEAIVLPKWELNKEFRDLLASFERVLPLLERSNLSAPEITFPLFELSKGSIGQLTRVLRRAAVEAIRNGDESITPEILAGLDAIDLGGV